MGSWKTAQWKTPGNTSFTAASARTLLRRDRSGLHPVARVAHSALRGAARTAEHLTAGLDAMPDDATAAVLTGRRDCVDRAFERVEDVRLAADGDLHRLVVVVSAHLALSHVAHLPGFLAHTRSE